MKINKNTLIHLLETEERNVRPRFASAQDPHPSPVPAQCSSWKAGFNYSDALQEMEEAFKARSAESVKAANAQWPARESQGCGVANRSQSPALVRRDSSRSCNSRVARKVAQENAKVRRISHILFTTTVLFKRPQMQNAKGMKTLGWNHAAAILPWPAFNLFFWERLMSLSSYFCQGNVPVHLFCRQNSL